MLFSTSTMIIMIGFFVVLAAIFDIAATSVSINCYNTYQGPDKCGSNKNFLIANMIFAFILFFMGIAVIWQGLVMPKTV